MLGPFRTIGTNAEGKVMRAIALTVMLAAISGCASQPALMKQTASGKAETTIEGVSVDEMRNELVLGCTRAGKEVQTDAHSVTCAHREEGGRGMAAQLLLGNSFSSTPYTKVKFTFAAVPGGVFITADPWLEMGMGFGEVQRVPLTNNGIRNELQSGLDQAAANARNRRASADTSPKVPSATTTTPAATSNCEACGRLGLP